MAATSSRACRLYVAAAALCAVALGGGAKGDRAGRAPSVRGMRVGTALRALRGGRLDDDDDDDDEALIIEEAMQLKALGNELVKAADFSGAAAKYGDAIRELDFDGKGSRRAAELDRRLRLNLASCLLRLGDVGKAAEHCTAVRRPPVRARLAITLALPAFGYTAGGGIRRRARR